MSNPAPRRPLAVAPRRAAIIALLTGLLALVILGHAAVAIVGALPPRLEYVRMETVYAGGHPVEWRLELRVRGEAVVASFYTEREVVRVTDELGR